MKNIIFLTSQNGATIRFIDHAIDKGLLQGYQLYGVIADRHCGAIEWAKKRGVFFKVVQYDHNHTCELFEELKDLRFDLAITNIHKIVDHRIIKEFEGKLINVHPSLLPAFKGFRPIENALKQGCRFIGTTVHYVDDNVDGGAIISQSVTPVNYSQEVAEITNEVFQAWCINLVNSILIINQFQPRYLTYSYNKTVFSPDLRFDTGVFNNLFWKKVKEYE